MTRAFHEFGEKTALRAKAEDRRASWTRPGLGYPSSSCSSAELDSVCPSVVILIDGDNLSIPGSVVFEHGVENDEQLAHASGENDFGLFAAAAEIALSQSLSKRSDVFVAAFGGEGGHVQGIPDGGASSPDGSGSHLRVGAHFGVPWRFGYNDVMSCSVRRRIGIAAVIVTRRSSWLIKNCRTSTA